MKNFDIFVNSLEYIERRLCEDITQEEIAAYCCCSLSTLQKLWKYCTHIGVMTYVKKRRLTLAARALVGGSGVLDTAVKYGYGSNEAFTRAFKGMWGITPSEFTVLHRSGRFTDLYPRYNNEYFTGGNYIMGRAKFDLTELFEKLQDKKGTYLVGLDIKGLMRINNELGRDMGDAVINTCIKRIDDALSGDMFAFRIGGDEFIVVTGFGDIGQAQKLRDKICAKNGETVSCGDISTEVFMHSGIMLYEGADCDLYDKFDKSIEKNS